MVFAPIEWMIAGRYVRARRSEGFISVIAAISILGIMLGVGALIIVLSVQNGLRAEFIKSVLGFKGHITVVSSEGVLRNHAGLANRLRQTEGVVSVTPLVEGQILATHKGRSSGAIIRGLSKPDLQKRRLVAENIRNGTLETFSGNNAILVGTRLARVLGANVGDQITLVSPNGTVTVFGTVPRMKAYTIIGTFEVGNSLFDGGFIFMPLGVAQRYFRLGDGVSKLEVFVEDPDALGEPRREIASALGPNQRLFDWQQENRSIVNALQVQKNVMFLIVALIILVAAFNIISSLIMLVKDKSSAIAILRTVGASRGMIMRVFFIAGTSIGFAGTLVGTVGGLLITIYIENIQRFIERLSGTELFSPEVYFLSRLPSEINPGEVVMIAGMALGISILATLYPSWRAARLDPVEALRYE
ncbi:MAG: lipoprotein-releasing ABC transporter permease subunit [Alphaproteobacteria bacterium]|nr:lipoprotein-releasing ABC transporter permease subunit [Alphaproteobacteria bacterium]